MLEHAAVGLARKRLVLTAASIHSTGSQEVSTRDQLIRYDTRCYFNVRSKADISQLNLPHGNRQLKKCKNRKKVKCMHAFRRTSSKFTIIGSSNASVMHFTRYSDDIFQVCWTGSDSHSRSEISSGFCSLLKLFLSADF